MSRYILIESGPIREKAVAIQTEYYATTGAWEDWCRKKFGHADVYHNRRQMVGVARRPDGPGWKREKHGFWSPKITTTEGKAMAKEMADLPKLPDIGHTLFEDVDTIGVLIGWECGNMRRPCLLWSQDAIVAVLSSKDILGVSSRPQDLERLMAWPVPEGCREITPAEWDLICARHKVEAEAKKAAASATA